jgi:rare lipoprotein A (peptidoglycan hydrolase)
MNAMTAAHQTLPFGTRIKVTNLENDRSAVLTVNDRGPFAPNRIVDVSRKAAAQLGFRKGGVARVRVRAVGDYAGQSHVEAAPAPRRERDADHFMPVLVQAMESEQRLEKFVWQNPASGRRGHIMPLTEADSAQTTGCRNYRRTAEDGNRRTVYVGRACRESGGSWRVAREDRNS